MRAGCARRGGTGRLAAALVVCALLLPAVVAITPAAARDGEPAPIVTAELGGGFIEFLFGRGGALRPQPEPQLAPPPSPAPAASTPSPAQSPSGVLATPAAPGVGTTFCVRTCDGYAFPLGTLRGRADADLHRRACAAACPGAPTALFVGSRNAGFAHARSIDDGRPYAALANAFLHRRERVAGCGCGLVAEPAARWAQGDATLRRGDVVVTADGALVFDGGGLVDFRDSRAAGPALRRKIDDRLGLTAREERRAAWLRARPAAMPVAAPAPGPSAAASPLPPPRPQEPVRIAEGPTQDEGE
ncbi:DUF2865 domain-containing protein [Salinarimonas chemoclinalis]|uniref:DUF2865 domain-containing protein n=1 Tax=Salinarimonas chemoclinalis TaxID=3241599 RepID=UPI003557306A